MEAADDNCYTNIDIEDGINLGLIAEEYALEYLINLVRENISTKKYNEMSQIGDRLSYLRALAISTLISDAISVFKDHENDILRGSFSSALLDKGKYQAQMDDIIKISKDKVYQSSEVIDKELAGYRVIQDLLSVYTRAKIAQKNGSASNYDHLLLKSLPEGHKNMEDSLYRILLNTCCFVASLSDSAAVHLHNKIMGKHF